jgi:cobalt-zinc-cadmium efflux system protein
MGAGHHHGQVAGPDGAQDQRRRLLLVLGLTATVMVVQVVGGLVTGSLALLADAAHMLTDVVGLGVAVLAATLALRPPTSRRTWGLRRAEVLGATVQAGLLLAVGVLVAVEAVRRLAEPPEVAAGLVLVFGAVGLAVNVVGLAVLARGRGASVNTRAAFLEVLADGVGSVAVLVSALVVLLTGWQRADAVASFVVVGLVVPRTLAILRETTGVLLEAVPRDLDLDDVRGHLLALPHVRGVHDLHASEIVSGLPVLSAHVVLDDDCFHDGHAPQVLDVLQRCVAEHFAVAVRHSTFQLEPLSHHGHEEHAHP